jgi:hypothetical protein
MLDRPACNVHKIHGFFISSDADTFLKVNDSATSKGFQLSITSVIS